MQALLAASLKIHASKAYVLQNFVQYTLHLFIYHSITCLMFVRMFTFSIFSFHDGKPSDDISIAAVYDTVDVIMLTTHYS